MGYIYKITNKLNDKIYIGLTTKQRASDRFSQHRYLTNHPEAREECRKRTKVLWQDEEYRKKVTESNKKFWSEHKDLMSGENNPMYGKKHTEKSLEKIRAYAATQKEKIAQLDKDTFEVIAVFDGIRDAEKALGVSHGQISKAEKQNKVAYGYRWKKL